MKFMIHACPQRIWYVERFLYPSLREQGISQNDITIWNDTDGAGCLVSFFSSLKDLNGDGTWHIQDDVILCRDFAKRTKEHDTGMVCGFTCRNFDQHNSTRSGVVPGVFHWWSFQCIRIPDDLARKAAEWFFTDAYNRPAFADKVVDKKHDDWFFREFIREMPEDISVLNLVPNLVDHIDFLIGGTVVNASRRIQNNRAAFWEDEDLVEELKAKIEKTRR